MKRVCPACDLSSAKFDMCATCEKAPAVFYSTCAMLVARDPKSPRVATSTERQDGHGS